MEQFVDVERLKRQLSEVSWAPAVAISRAELLAVLTRLEQAEQAVARVHALNNELSWSPSNVPIVQRYRDALDGEPNE